MRGGFGTERLFGECPPGVVDLVATDEPVAFVDLVGHAPGDPFGTDRLRLGPADVVPLSDAEFGHPGALDAFRLDRCGQVEQDERSRRQVGRQVLPEPVPLARAEVADEVGRHHSAEPVRQTGREQVVAVHGHSQT